jgi:hypothetical protein
MRSRAALLSVLVVAAPALAGCFGATAPADDDRALPPGWDDEVPERSTLADRPYYVLRESTTFLAKETSYARYVFEVPQRVPHASVFFSTGKGFSQARAPSVDDDVYHYEFMQLRPLGDHVRVLDVDAATQFRYGSTGHMFSLTYVYGNGANYQYLAPFDGDPGDWELDAGFYEVVIATDENLTVGLNIDLGTDYWSTLYHPQELGVSRAAALDFGSDIRLSSGKGLPDYSRQLTDMVNVRSEETLNLFAFADLIYDVRPFPTDQTAVAIAADGVAIARFGDDEVRERLAVTTVTPTKAEAFAYVALFNEPGPYTMNAVVRVDFQEEASVDSVQVVQLMVFGVAVTPTQTLQGIPQPVRE